METEVHFFFFRRMRAATMSHWARRIGSTCSIETMSSLKVVSALKPFASSGCKGKPTVIIANTTKGCGSSVMENKAEWHHKVPTLEEVEQIMKDLDERKEALS